MDKNVFKIFKITVQLISIESIFIEMALKFVKIKLRTVSLKQLLHTCNPAFLNYIHHSNNTLQNRVIFIICKLNSKKSKHEDNELPFFID